MTTGARRPRAVRRLFKPDPAADVREELRFHLDATGDDLARQGWPIDEATRVAERRFGDVRAVQQLGECIGDTMERRRRMIDCQ